MGGQGSTTGCSAIEWRETKSKYRSQCSTKDRILQSDLIVSQRLIFGIPISFETLFPYEKSSYSFKDPALSNNASFFFIIKLYKASKTEMFMFPEIVAQPF
jgi:hypothetical protein